MEKSPKALVSGASRGIGRSFCLGLLKRGFQVHGLSRQSPDFCPHEAFTHYPCDLTKAKELEKLRPGLQKLCPEVILCNAGIGLFGNLEQIGEHDLRRLFEVNFFSHVNLIRWILPFMKKRGSGKIFLIGSEAALEGKRQGSIYCASKFALRGFSQSLRDECASSGIQISLVNPGMVRTDFFNSLHFKPGEAKENALDVETISKLLLDLLDLPSNAVVDEINLRPLTHVIQKNA